jgi:hypothetical protein
MKNIITKIKSPQLFEFLEIIQDTESFKSFKQNGKIEDLIQGISQGCHTSKASTCSSDCDVTEEETIPDTPTKKPNPIVPETEEEISIEEEQ